MNVILRMKYHLTLLHDKTKKNWRRNHENPASIFNLEFSLQWRFERMWKRREFWDFDFLLGVGFLDLERG